MNAGNFILYGCLVVAVILHEISHGIVALVYGDDTAKRAGRLTLNPIPHIDPLGSVLLPAMAILASSVSGARVPVFGWAKPVPVSPFRLRNLAKPPPKPPSLRPPNPQTCLAFQ